MMIYEDEVNSKNEHGIPRYSWSRRFDAPNPSPDVHTFSRPPIFEALSLLPIAVRVGSYLFQERNAGREPIFDLNGIALEPPKPGPHAGVPLGGLGGGCIGRGFRGDFRRWSLRPGKYIHHVVDADQFCLRVRRPKMNTIESVVLSSLQCPTASSYTDFSNSERVEKNPLSNTMDVPKNSSYKSAIRSWNWNMRPGCATYYALFPIAWTVYEDVLPGITVIIKQISPFLPNSYSEASLPCAVFEVQVLNTFEEEGADVSVMLTFQNGIRARDAAVGELKHTTFKKIIPSTDTTMTSSVEGCAVEGVCMPQGYDNKSYNSFSIAAQSSSSNITCCSQFITEYSTESSFNCNTHSAMTSAEKLWTLFTSQGEINEVLSNKELSNGSKFGQKVASAVCVREYIEPSKSCSMSFSLSWEQSHVSFGSTRQSSSTTSLPRYYTRFFGDSGINSPILCSYALTYYKDWEERIVHWQQATMLQCFQTLKQYDSLNLMEHGASYYQSQLFNELYYLVDGGTVWTNSTAGFSNKESTNELKTSSNVDMMRCAVPAPVMKLAADLPTPITENSEHSTFGDVSVRHFVDPVAIQERLKCINLQEINKLMLQHDLNVQYKSGQQEFVGQFLYLEGHEYLMYNTYDVHFYSSFALLSLWPQLELSLQRDFALAVNIEDLTMRIMMGTGCKRPRKVKGVVPHDLGSPSEEPWIRPNIYNFQDVSRWKDLGPKMILQIYRDYNYMKNYYQQQLQQQHQHQPHEEEEEEKQLLQSHLQFLIDVYPTLVEVMKSTEEFDTDGDGMIENSGFPDQTYDIWIAKGIHAYCGGLWITACEAMKNICKELLDNIHNITTYYKNNIIKDKTIDNDIIIEYNSLYKLMSHYDNLSIRGRDVYIKLLWNGLYLNYDSSLSLHHNSIMADMCAGQWYAHVCNLSPILTTKQAFSCYHTIYECNVISFGNGKLLGAVNGMRLSRRSNSISNINSNIRDYINHFMSLNNNYHILLDNSCLQSREVWTGTTYALAAAMLQEALYSSSTSTSTSTPFEWSKLLLSMGFTTAQGIHDAGWQEFGYWFATPEGWEQSGNYRSLSYMRPLCIWAMQYALQQHAQQK